MEVSGIVGSTCTVKEDGSLEYTSKEKENYPRCVPCVSLIFFSAWPGVTFTPFTVNERRQETLEEVFHSTFLRKTNSEKVSAAVVLTNNQSQDVIEFSKLLRKQYPGTIVSGGIGYLPWSTALNGQHLKRNLEMLVWSRRGWNPCKKAPCKMDFKFFLKFHIFGYISLQAFGFTFEGLRLQPRICLFFSRKKGSSEKRSA